MVIVFGVSSASAGALGVVYSLYDLRRRRSNRDLMKFANMISGARGVVKFDVALINALRPASSVTSSDVALINTIRPASVVASGYVALVDTIRPASVVASSYVALVNTIRPDEVATNSQPGVFICKTLGEGTLKGRASVKQYP